MNKLALYADDGVPLCKYSLEPCREKLQDGTKTVLHIPYILGGSYVPNSLSPAGTTGLDPRLGISLGACSIWSRVMASLTECL